MDEDKAHRPNSAIELTGEIVSAYVSRNHMQASELPALIASVHTTLSRLGDGEPTQAASPQKATAAEIKKSVQHDGIVSFEDGKSYKTMRRHLTMRGLTPEAYRQKWGLPSDYPMTSAGYSAQRSALAKSLGLGNQRRRSAPEIVEEPPAAPKTRGRKKKVTEPA